MSKSERARLAELFTVVLCACIDDELRAYVVQAGVDLKLLTVG